jgi:hypothetical protein
LHSGLSESHTPWCHGLSRPLCAESPCTQRHYACSRVRVVQGCAQGQRRLPHNK